MKKTILAVTIGMLFSGCTSKTVYGDCIGVLQDKKPDLVYQLSIWNTAMAVIFSETIVVPVVVITNQHSCPTGKK